MVFHWPSNLRSAHKVMPNTVAVNIHIEEEAEEDMAEWSIDCKPLSLCTQLTNLGVYNLSESTTTVDLSNLPKSLREISLKGCQFSCDGLALHPRHGNIETLHIQGLDTSQLNYRQPQVLALLDDMPNLKVSPLLCDAGLDITRCAHRQMQIYAPSILLYAVQMLCDLP